MLRAHSIVLGVLLATGPCFAAAADAQRDKDMERLAQAKGCNTCHTAPAAKDNLPIGPTWPAVAKRYKGQKDAVNRLTRIVVEGSGPGYGGRHWKDQAKGAAMPSNAMGAPINETDARKLVQWILVSDQ